MINGIFSKLLYSATMLISSIFGTHNIISRPQQYPANNINTKSIYDFTLRTIDEKELSLSRYRGKKMLIVNTASECGYTPQYEDLQKLHEQYGSKVEVLGFPANNFGAQEPGSNSEIVNFCKTNYGITFQMFEKISEIGADQHPLYKWLSTKEENGWNDQAPKWNFCKYLIDEKGALIKFYPSKVKPLSEEIIGAL